MKQIMENWRRFVEGEPKNCGCGQDPCITYGAQNESKEKEEEDFKPHMMYDPKTGKGVKAETYEKHVELDKKGWSHEKPEVDEAKNKDGKEQGADGKACWDGYRHAGTDEDGKDKCVPVDEGRAKMMDPKEKEERIRQVVHMGSYDNIEGQMLDLFSASAIVKVLDALNDHNKSRYLSLPIVDMAKMAMRMMKENLLREFKQNEAYSHGETADVETLVSLMQSDPEFRIFAPYAEKFARYSQSGGSVVASLEAAVPDFVAGKHISALLAKASEMNESNCSDDDEELEEGGKCTKATEKTTSTAKGKKYMKCIKNPDGEGYIRKHWGEKGARAAPKGSKRNKSFRARHGCSDAKAGTAKKLACDDW